MARVTVEDCLARIPNRFALTILASRRARALSEGRGRALVACENKEGVTALREISDARVRYKEDVQEAMDAFIEEQRRQLRVTTGEHTFLEAASLRALEEDEDEAAAAGEPADDVEELQTDPEALNKQAQGAATDADSDEEETTPASPEGTEDPFEEEEAETAAEGGAAAEGEGEGEAKGEGEGEGEKADAESE